MLLTVVLALLALFLGTILVRALLVRGKKLTSAPAPSEEEALVLAKKLQRMIQCPTVSYKDKHEDEPFAQLRKVMAEEFPLIHQRCEKRIFSNDCWVYKLSGKDESRNILLMSHHDVVEGKGEWKYPPFSGEIAEGKLWGRGTVDTKTPLFGEFAALEQLLSEGWEPDINVWIASSANEEHCGDGIPLANEWFKEQGIAFELILDEGGAVIDPPIGGMKCEKCAMVAIHEKGRHSIELTASEGSHHAGLTAGKKATPAERIAALVTEVQKGKVFIRRLGPEMRRMLETLAPYASFPMRLIFSNLWCFSPVLAALLPKISSQAAGLLGTTCAFYDIKTAEGSYTCTAKTLLRCVNEEDFHKDLKALETLAASYGIELSRGEQWEYHAPADPTLPAYDTVAQCIGEVFPDVPVIPFILPAGTDARTLTDVCPCVLRFAPIRLSAQQLASVHSENENIGIAAVEECVRFYRCLLKKFG